MATTLEELEQRLAALEQEVARLRQQVGAEQAAERGARLLREAKVNQGQLAAAWAKTLAEMGIQGQPIGAEKVQELIAACGFKPEDNAFSRGIIEMREE